MNNKLFVAGLPWSVDDEQLRDLFSQYGAIISAKVIIDRDTNRSKGFGFVEFNSAEDANNALKALDGSDLEGRKLVVNVARPQESRPRR